MVSVLGTYNNGIIKLSEVYSNKTPMKVIVTFLEDDTVITDTPLTLADFSFAKSRQNLAGITESLSEAVIQERREG